ncbi:DoxX family protein [Leptobacterium flavescens]|uniref:DoxX family protein n=1 Tax=Leptobacterium flavescens TaxID=472055 RepID=A0A6P0UID8_9FLAO|nr:DoxX family protein [Leptobacterium flavescens]NER13014.1 DoxX family protein [Leptobacterium flavescens]
MNKFLTILKWTLIVLMALLFLSSAYPKILPNTAMINRFEAWGYQKWFLQFIGIAELLGTVLLCIPRFSFYGALTLIAVMIGAVYTHLSTGIGSPGFAIITMILLALIAFLWKKETLLRPNSNKKLS